MVPLDSQRGISYLFYSKLVLLRSRSATSFWLTGGRTAGMGGEEGVHATQTREERRYQWVGAVSPEFVLGCPVSSVAAAAAAYEVLLRIN